MDDDSFPGYVAGRLPGLPGVQAVTLGGSRAEGTHRPDSDWDGAWLTIDGRRSDVHYRDLDVVDREIAAVVDRARSLCSRALAEATGKR